MTDSIRSFIAIELSDEVRAALAGLQNRLKTLVPPNTVRWTATQNIHLTLHFLGNISANEVAKVAEVLEASASAYPPISLTLAGLGCFPNTRRPRIVWVGVLGQTSTLAELHQDLGQRLNQAVGFSPETRPYSPHLTIGRVQKGVPQRHLTQLGEVLERAQPDVGQLATLRVTEVSLMRSELQPAGPIYTQLGRGAFRGNV